ncbi:complex I NDUFA9 subunit family protein [Halococcus saccharolyticus]|uniref:NAD-dependent epimerase/dehydratase n=1 Tax=Halococcus saccharolyticus DSM 5350 TaxID=1227455 RepID=M0MLX1_9EURY|nr:complex I NDUFA9 subunit family protein [Halococcus saccharolyticus]EMA46656.1 NAD-dependent epimerase/dehydratase [Halococcus saccharolyticus DSM 5350]
MDVLVTGGDGFVGRHLCDELADRGHDVTALSRDPDPSVFEADVETAIGDVTAYDSMEGAFADQDAVVNLVALSPLFQPSGGDEQHFEIHLGGTENAVRAAEEHGVERLVQMSALGADPQGSTAYIRSKGEAEQVVRDSALDWTIFRPSVVFGDGGEFVSFTKKLTPPYLAPLPRGGRTRFQPIWIGDLVPMLADAVTEDGHTGETYEIGGPATLTLADVAKLAYRAEGKSVSIVPVPMGLTKLGMGLADPLPVIPFGSDQARSLEMDNTVADNDVAAFGRDVTDLQSLADYLGVA